MNSTVRQRWIDALESGHYSQGIGCLHSPKGTFCCLGVLVDAVYLTDHPEKKWRPSNLGGRMAIGDEDASLPYKFRRSAEISIKAENNLIRLNDEKKLSFKEIARILAEGREEDETL